jgi:hypothetical protein
MRPSLNPRLISTTGPAAHIVFPQFHVRAEDGHRYTRWECPALGVLGEEHGHTTRTAMCACGGPSAAGGAFEGRMQQTEEA